MKAPAHSEIIMASKVLDKCDEGLAVLEPTLDFVQQSKRLVRRLLVSKVGLQKHPGSIMQTSGWKSGRWRTVFEAVSGGRDGCTACSRVSTKRM